MPVDTASPTTSNFLFYPAPPGRPLGELAVPAEEDAELKARVLGVALEVLHRGLPVAAWILRVVDFLVCRRCRSRFDDRGFGRFWAFLDLRGASRSRRRIPLDVLIIKADPW